MKTSLLISIVLIVFAWVLMTGQIRANTRDNLLRNPGFEEGDVGWQTYNTTFDRVGSPVYEGNFTAAITSNSAQPKWIYQVVRIAPGESYTLSGRVIRDAPDEQSAVYLCLSFESDDGSGKESELLTSYSAKLTQNHSEYQLLTVTAIAPDDARLATVKAVLQSFSEMTTVAYFDDLTFSGPAPADVPIPEPTPSLTPTQTPAPTSIPINTPVSTTIPASTPTPVSMTTPVNEGDILINEVQYDPPQDEVDSPFEWFEILNRTDDTIELIDWSIEDNYGIDPIPSLAVQPGGFAVIAAGTSFYTNFPDFHGVIVFIPDGSIGNGLSNTGDCLTIVDASGKIIDALSYGQDFSVMSPSCRDVAEGHSLERWREGVDTDQSSDFVDGERPSPGYGFIFSTPTPVPSSTMHPASTPVAAQELMPDITPAPALSTSPVVSTDSSTTTATPTPGAMPGPASSFMPLPTQMPLYDGQSRSWLSTGMPALISFVGLGSLAFVLLLRRRQG